MFSRKIFLFSAYIIEFLIGKNEISDKINFYITGYWGSLLAIKEFLLLNYIGIGLLALYLSNILIGIYLLFIEKRKEYDVIDNLVLLTLFAFFMSFIQITMLNRFGIIFQEMFFIFGLLRKRMFMSRNMVLRSGIIIGICFFFYRILLLLLILIMEIIGGVL